MAKRAVSLSDELHLLLKTAVGACTLVERSMESPPDGSLGAAELLPAIVAILVLLTERLRLVDRVVRGSVDARLLLCPENEARRPQQGDEEDVVLPVWSQGEQARHPRGEWTRAKRNANRNASKPVVST